MSSGRLLRMLAVVALAALCGACAPAAPRPAPAPETTPTPSLAPEARDAVEKARADLARRLAVAPEAIAIVAAEPATWGDTSLGLPEPGKVYAQVVTQGYVVTLRHEGQSYVYHVARNIVRFNPHRSAPLPKAGSPLADRLAEAGVPFPVLGLAPPPPGFALARVEYRREANPPRAALEYRAGGAPQPWVRVEISPLVDDASLPGYRGGEALWARERLLGVEVRLRERWVAWVERGLRIDLGSSDDVSLADLVRLADSLEWQASPPSPGWRIEVPEAAGQVHSPLYVRGSLPPVPTATVELLLWGQSDRLLARSTAALTPTLGFEGVLGFARPQGPQPATLVAILRQGPAGPLVSCEVRDLTLVPAPEPAPLAVREPAAGATVTSPLVVAGTTGGSLEPVRVRLVAEGVVLAEQVVPVQLTAVRREGEFRTVLSFLPPKVDRQGQVEVFSGAATQPRELAAAVVPLAVAAGQSPGRVELLEPAPFARVTLPCLVAGQTRRPQENLRLRLSYGWGQILEQPALPIAWGDGGLFLVNLDLTAPGQELPEGSGQALLQVCAANGEVLASRSLTLEGRDRREMLPVYLVRPPGELARATRGIAAPGSLTEMERLQGALDQLFAGPTLAERSLQGLSSALPTPLDVRATPRRSAGWGYRVALKRLVLRGESAEVWLSPEALASPNPPLAHRQVVQTVRELSGRRVVDVFAGEALWNPEATGAPEVVLTAPEAGAELRAQALVRGRATVTAERQVRVRVVGAKGDVLLEAWVAVQGGEPGAEGTFEAVLTLPGCEPQVGRVEAFYLDRADAHMLGYAGVEVRLARPSS